MLSVDENLRNGGLVYLCCQGLSKCSSIRELIELHESEWNRLLVEQIFGPDTEWAPALREHHDLVLSNLSFDLRHVVTGLNHLVCDALVLRIS